MRRLIVFLFFVSGACALVDEIVWMRLLGTVIGNTTWATSIVLAVFMGGLGLGGQFAGRAALGTRTPLRAYALCEAGIGLYAALSPLVLVGVERLYDLLAAAGLLGTGWLAVARVAAAGAVLVLPTLLMGATFPLVASWLVRSAQQMPDADIGRAYGWNTMGGVAGAVAAAAWLLPGLGIVGTLLVSGGLSLLVAVAAWRVSGRASASPGPAPAPEPAAGVPAASLTILQRETVYAALGLLGVAALASEVAWSRVLAQVLGGSVYAYAATVAAYLTGIGVGGLLVRFLSPVGITGFALVTAAGGAALVIVMPLVERLPLWYVQLYGFTGGRFWATSAGAYGLAALVLTLPGMMSGAAFPAGLALLGSDRRTIGSGYLANTIGSLVGALLAGFVWLPLVGAQNALFLAVLCQVTAAALIAVFAAGDRRAAVRITGALAVVGILAATSPRWRPESLAAGVYTDASQLWKLLKPSRDRAGELTRLLFSSDLVYFREGRAATVAVKRFRSGHLNLSVNGKVDASTLSTDMRTQRWLAHLPMILHGGAKDVVVIGLGSGVTLGTVAQYPVDRVTCFELEPAVAEASRLFVRVNHAYWQDARVKVVFDDARAGLRRDAATHDVIISEPSNPWVAGASTLFTEDFYRLCRGRLRPGGIMCQWLHIYRIRGEDLRLAVRTFQSVFPDATLWWSSVGDLVLIGTPVPQKYPLERMGRDVASGPGARDLREVGVTSAWHFAGHRIFGADGLRAWAGAGPIHTDWRPLLEFRAPLGLSDEGAVQRHTVELRAAWSDVGIDLETPGLSETERDRALGLAYLEGGLARLAVGRLSKAAAERPRDAEALRWLGQAHLLGGEPAPARRELESSRSLDPSEPLTRLYLAKACAEAGNLAAATREMRAARRLAPKSALVAYFEGEVALAAGHRDAAARAWGDSVRLAPRFAPAWVRLGKLWLEARAPEKAVAALERAFQLSPQEEGVQALLREAYLSLRPDAGVRPTGL